MNFITHTRFQTFVAVAFLQFGDWVSTLLFSWCGGAEGNPIFRLDTGAPDLAKIAVIKIGLLVAFAFLLIRKRGDLSRMFSAAIVGFCWTYSGIVIWNVSLTIFRLIA